MLHDETIKNPLWLPIAALVIGAVLVAGGVMNLLNEEQRHAVGGGMAIGIGVLSMVGALQLFAKREFLTLTSRGIVPATGGLIPWGDLQGMEHQSVGLGKRRTQFVVITLRDRARYDASHRLGASAPLRWRVPTIEFGESAVARTRAYAQRVFSQRG